MNHVPDPRALITVVALALAACTSDGTSSATPSAPRVTTHVYRGPSGTSRVMQALAADGVESLQGSTDLPGRGRLNEVATLDARGRLRYAEITAGGSAGAARFTLDSKESTVRIERGGAAPIVWHVPGDAPWLYSPGAGESLALTPVAAWIALRASRAAGVVRVLDPELQESHLVMSDQIAVPTERGTTIAIGHGADADDRFITELRLHEGDVSLSRVPSADLGA